VGGKGGAPRQCTSWQSVPTTSPCANGPCSSSIVRSRWPETFHNCSKRTPTDPDNMIHGQILTERSPLLVGLADFSHLCFLHTQCETYSRRDARGRARAITWKKNHKEVVITWGEFCTRQDSHRLWDEIGPPTHLQLPMGRCPPSTLKAGGRACLKLRQPSPTSPLAESRGPRLRTRSVQGLPPHQLLEFGRGKSPTQTPPGEGGLPQHQEDAAPHPAIRGKQMNNTAINSRYAHSQESLKIHLPSFVARDRSSKLPDCDFN